MTEAQIKTLKLMRLIADEQYETNDRLRSDEARAFKRIAEFADELLEETPPVAPLTPIVEHVMFNPPQE